MSARICVLGAGSATFSLGLVRDLCLAPELRGSRLTLVDTHPGRLAAIQRFASRYAAELGFDLDVRATADRRAALPGADFVVNAALAAGHERLRAGWDVARRLGYRFGGSLHVLHDEAWWINFHQFRLFDAILADLAELCPDAWYVQLANPVQAGITHLVRSWPGLRIVGLCHGWSGVHSVIDGLGLSRDRCTFDLPGVNHFIWLTRLECDGRDALPLIDRWIETRSEAAWAGGVHGELGPKKCDLYRRLGAFPIGDTAGDGGGSWGWWYHVDEATERRWQEDPARFWERFFREGEDRVAAIGRAVDEPGVPLAQRFPPESSGEHLVPLIGSLAGGPPRELICNLRNQGPLLPGIPEDYAVEVRARVGEGEIRGLGAAPLPPPVLGWMRRDCLAPVELELEAYRAGSRELLRELILMDPWTGSRSRAEELIDTVMALPFHGELRAHYR